VVASVLLVCGVIVLVGAPVEDWPLYLVPAALVPLLVAPAASHLVLELAFELEEAHAVAVQQEAQLRALLEHAPIGIARLDQRGGVISANPRMRALLGPVALDATAGWSRVFRVATEHTAFMEAIQHARPLEDTRWQWVDPVGRERTVRAALVPMPEGTAAPAGVGPDCVLLAEDITEREAVEDQLLRTQKLDLVDRLAGGLAHDFNNLLTVIRASVAAMGGAAAGPELAAIDDAAGRGARLTRRLLAIGRHNLLTLSPHALAPMLTDTVELLRRTLPERIRVEAPTVVPDVTLALDPDAVLQALLNLGVNARDAIADQGVIRLAVREAEYEGAAMLVLSVEDDGDGMPESVRARALEPFFTTKSADAGTGLGLVMVHGTMRRHSGRLVLDSTPGVGTRVELWFPVAANGNANGAPSLVSTPMPAAPAADGAAADDATVTTLAAANAPHLLLVEDERAVRIATERALQRLGYAVTSTPDMATALRVMASDTPVDLIVTDVMMPGGSGVELLHALREFDARTPVLLVSGYAVENLEAVLAADARTALLTKPWTLDRLEAQMRTMLSDTLSAK
jgi:PAS domain S-box-containing protein